MTDTVTPIVILALLFRPPRLVVGVAVYKVVLDTPVVVAAVGLDTLAVVETLFEIGGVVVVGRAVWGCWLMVWWC